MQNHRSKIVNLFVIGTFVGLYLIVSIISTIHVIEFFELSNPKWLSVSLAVAFEIGAAASLSSLIVLDKMNRFLVWSLFIVLTCMQAMGNTYYAYTHIHDFQSWSELFGLVEEDIIYQKRLLSIISGAILPLVALGFIKSLVDYIKPESEEVTDLSEQNLDNSFNPVESIENVQQEEILKKAELEQVAEDPKELHYEEYSPSGEMPQSANRGKAGYLHTDLDPTKIT